MREVYLGLALTWRGAIIRSNLNAGVKYVLLILAEFCSGMGSMIYPGKKQLAELAGVPVKHVEKALKEARDLGWLSYDQGWGGGDPMFKPTLPRDAKGITGCVELERSGTPAEGSDTLSLDQARVANLAEHAALNDPLVVAALQELGGKITNIRVTGEVHDVTSE